MSELLHHWVATQAEGRPNAIAVAMGGTRLTYGELEAQGNRLARALRDSGCRPGDRVCFLIPKSPTAILSIIGILKAGLTYVPLDPAGPASRLAKIIQACEPRCVLAAGPVAPLLGETLSLAGQEPSPALGWLEADVPGQHAIQPSFSLQELDAYPSGRLDDRVREDSPAYIFFTSGSTGIPKGVVISHANVARFVHWANRYFGMEPSDRVSGHSPLHFDLSVYDIFGAFQAGAELHLVPHQANLLPNELARFIRAAELTQWFSVPSALTYMAKFDVVAQGDFPHLKRVLWCGEVLPTPVLVHWMQRLPHVQFTNLYGPTEATIASSYYTVPECPKDPAQSVPIGMACEGEEILVFDEQLQPVPVGEIGDLYIAGAGLSQGYWRDPEKTAQAFVADPRSERRIYKTGDLAKAGPDGLIYFMGRADTQIKSRGYRIELDEVETALNALGFLAEAAVVAVESESFAGKVIACAYSPLQAMEVTPVEVGEELRKALPSYMLPVVWASYERLPRNANGKIDRPKLREELRERASTASD